MSHSELSNKIQEILVQTTYKEKPLFENIPINNEIFDATKFLNLESLDLTSQAEIDLLKDRLNTLKKIVETNLEEVKKIMLAQTTKMGVDAQNMVNKSGMTLNLENIAKSSDLSYLKQQVKTLLEQ